MLVTYNFYNEVKEKLMGSIMGQATIRDGDTDLIKFHPQCAGETPRKSVGNNFCLPWRLSFVPFPIV